MSVKITSAVWEDRTVTEKSHILVLLALADFCDDEGYCWPSIKVLAVKCRLTQRGLQKIIKKLLAIGILEIHAQGGGRVTNEYRVRIGSAPQGTLPFTPEPRSPPEPGNTPPPNAETSPNKGSVNDPSQTRAREESDAENVYQAYPRKVGRPAALNSILKAIAKHGYATVIEKTMAFAKVRAGQSNRFTPNPTTFFNQERYNDDPSTWTDSASSGKTEPEWLTENRTRY